MKILVTGAAGMLGTSLVPVLERCGHTVLASDINHIGGMVSYLDARSLEDMMRVGMEYVPDILIHLAAETDLEICESRPDYAYLENFIATQNASFVCQKLSIPLVYVSTAGVFDGKKPEPYTEFDIPNPINVYGMSKYQGELAVRSIVPTHFIVRAGWMIGGGERDKKFVHKIISQLRGGASRIFAVGDRLGTPTYTNAFSVVLEKLIRTKLYGTYHLACKGRASRCDVAAEILRILGRTDVELSEVTSEHFAEEYFAPRPASEEMRNYVLDLRSMNEMPDWREALREYILRDFSDFVK